MKKNIHWKAEITNSWDIWTIAYHYTETEIKELYDNLIQSKWVIAGQPIQKGKWKCDNFCDIENHHMHAYCTICNKQIYSGMEMDHGCKFGFGIGTIHPDMNSLFLVNDVFWEELQQEEEKWDDQAAKDIAKIKQINKYYINELNGEETSHIPLVEPLEKSFGKRFQA